ncbi:GGDEF domain-containing protein [Actinoplanes missouriensis]|uniref:GGDEF domain-containing protein n=1 Tax=Actinoplanes missouriensis TaxID=1866 RepID=UPI0033FD7A85
MRTAIDDSLRSRRRTIETAALVSRSIGLIYTIVYVAGIGSWAPPHISSGMQVVCWLGIAAMSTANVLAWFGRRRPESRWYSPFSALQIALDTLTIVAFVIVSTRETPQATWPLLGLTITIAAIRHRLLGAMLVYLVTTVAFAATAPDSARHDIAFVAGINLMLAVITGTQSTAFSRQLLTLQETRQALHHQANHDALTGLPNRSQLAEYAASRSGQPMAVLLLDLNGFKQVNDHHGHAAGDQLLHEVGVRLRGALGADAGSAGAGAGARARAGARGVAGEVSDGGRGDLAGRLGGDEFLVLLPDADANRAAQVADRIRDAIRRPIRIAGEREVTVGVSIGVALRPAGADTTLDALTAEADGEMYQEKRARNLAA